MNRSMKIILLVGTFLGLAALPGIAMAKEAQTIWKSGTVVPKGVGYAMQIDDILAPGIMEATNNHVRLKTYYGGVLGDDEDFIRMVLDGKLEACGLSAQGALMACPDMSVLALPFLFEGYEEVDHVKKKMYPVFDQMLGKRGFKFILWLDQAFDQFYSVNSPLASVDDFSQATFITWNGALEEELFSCMDVSPIKVDIPQFNQTIRQGKADSYIGPPIWCVATQLYSVVRYVNVTEVRYSPAMLLVSQKVWDQLDEVHQKGIANAREDWQSRFCMGSRADNRKCLEGMFRYGVTKVEMSPEESKKLKKLTLPLHQKMAGKLYSPELLAQINGILKEYRESQ